MRHTGLLAANCVLNTLPVANCDFEVSMDSALRGNRGESNSAWRHLPVFADLNHYSLLLTLIFTSTVRCPHHRPQSTYVIE